ncbi:hypothetical protein T03_16954, partial [Trichinella britovi]
LESLATSKWNTEQDACTATPTRYPGTAVHNVDGLPVVGRPAGGPRDPTTAAMVMSWPVECPPECSRDMHVLWQQRRSWVDEDGLI